ncbi:hypothetical protein LEMLEM_LOCUS3917 [Lemmus lemmus]
MSWNHPEYGQQDPVSWDPRLDKKMEKGNMS